MALLLLFLLPLSVAALAEVFQASVFLMEASSSDALFFTNQNEAGLVESNGEECPHVVTDICASSDGSLVAVAIQSLHGVMLMCCDFSAGTLSVSKTCCRAASVLSHILKDNIHCKERGHPTTRPLKTKSIDYEKMGLVCGNDMATGQFVRSSSSAPSIDLMQESSNYSNSDDVPIRVDDLECDSRGGGTSGESSSKKKEVRKRARDVEVFVTGMKESATLVQHMH